MPSSLSKLTALMLCRLVTFSNLTRFANHAMLGVNPIKTAIVLFCEVHVSKVTSVFSSYLPGSFCKHYDGW